MTTTARGRTALLLLLALVVGLAVAFGWRMTANAQARQTIEPMPTNWPRVEVATVQVRDVSDHVEVTGITRGLQQATLRAEITGTVAHVHVELGDWVREGSILLELRDAAEVAVYQQALARYEQARAEYEFATVDYERASRLYDEAMNRDYGITEIDLRQKQQRRDAAQGALRAGAAAVLAAREAVRRTVVLAPFTGVVTERFVDRGALVSPTTPLVRLDDLRHVKVQLALSESDLGRLDTTAPVERIRLATRRTPLTGRISAVSPSARADGLFPVEVTLTAAGLANIDFDAAPWQEHAVPLETNSVYVREVHDANPFGPTAADKLPGQQQPTLVAQHRLLRGAVPRDVVPAGVTARVTLPRQPLRHALVVPESALGRTPADEFFVVVVERERMLVDYFGPAEEALAETARRVPVTVERYAGRYAVLGVLAGRPTGEDEVLRTIDGRALPLRVGQWVALGKQQELRTGDPLIVTQMVGTAAAVQ